MPTHTNIPFKGNKMEVKAIKRLAAELDMTMGELVADAMKKAYGEQIKPHLAFFASRGDQSTQLDTEKRENTN